MFTSLRLSFLLHVRVCVYRTMYMPVMPVPPAPCAPASPSPPSLPLLRSPPSSQPSPLTTRCVLPSSCPSFYMYFLAPFPPPPPPSSSQISLFLSLTLVLCLSSRYNYDNVGIVLAYLPSGVMALHHLAVPILSRVLFMHVDILFDLLVSPPFLTS